jgi:predicted O-linked N-acetylglucosamine transferase (SPINDLY family)
MGVPVITLVGKTHVSRVGLSLLSTLRLIELIARSPQEYVNMVVKLASNPDYLQKLRATLRNRMTTSPLLDAPSFTRHLETIYLRMWENWCISL